MKDYESYRNNGNKDIPDNPKLKKNEFFYMQFQDNILPGEYFDCRVNGLECELDDDDKFAYDSGEKGSKQPELDDVKELTNAISNTSSTAATSSGSIVESAGAIATGTVTAVVGASAAVVAFNAVTKVQPKMTVNKLESGSSYVHYSLDVSNLELDKDYDIIIRNNQHEFKLDCVNGINDEYVYNLLPGLEYSLTLVGYNELLGEIPYISKTFYTLSSKEVLGYSNIEIIYNDDLTCGIKYDTTMVDDLNKAGDTFIVVKALTEDQGDEEWELFNSLYAEEYMREEPNKYTYEYAKKVHKGTISEVPPGIITIELYKIGPVGEEWNGELVASTQKEIIYPIYEKSDTNYIEFTGDYNLIKEVKKINIKKDNLSIKLSLYNDDNVETFIEKDLDISNGTFDFRQLVKQDTTSYSYKIGYYKADKSFVVVKEKVKSEFYGGYYGAYYEPVFSAYEYDKFDIKWNYDSSDNETMDIKILTGFDNYGNDDCYYKVDLLRKIYHEETDPTYEVVDTYIGTGNAIFYNVPVYYVQEAWGEEGPAYYRFAYTSLMNYYDEEKGTVQVSKETYEDDNYENDFIEDLSISSTLSYRGDGTFILPVDKKYEGDQSVVDLVRADATLHFYKSDYNVITDTLNVSGANVAQFIDENVYLVFDKKFPTGVVGSYVTYEIYYKEVHGNNIRRAKSKEMVMLYDLGYKVEASLEKLTYSNEFASGEIHLSAYMPDDATLRARTEYGDPIEVPKVDGEYVYTFEEASLGSNIYVDVYDKDGNQFTNEAYSLYIMSVNDFDYQQGYINYYKDDATYHVIFTYNDDGTVNLYCDTGLSTNYEYQNPPEYSMIVNLDVFDINVSEDTIYSGSKDITEDNKLGVFKNMIYKGSSTEYTIRYDYIKKQYDSFYAKQIIETHIGSSFLVTESNYYTIHPNGQLVGYNMYDENLGQNIISLTIPAGMIYDKDQTITFTGTFDGDEWSPITVKLSDYLSSSTSDGDVYVFNIDPTYVEQAENKDAKIMYNYTLTDDNYNQIKDIYSGSLYKEYSILITGV